MSTEADRAWDEGFTEGYAEGWADAEDSFIAAATTASQSETARGVTGAALKSVK